MAKYSSGIVGFGPDEHKLLDAAPHTRKAGFKKFDALTPFPVHGLDEACGLNRSWIPWVTFVFGVAGFLAGWGFQYYVNVVDWPVIIGGKPHHSLPAFVPVMFELTILFGALSSVAACFFVACRLPKVDPPVIDPELSCNKFALFVPESDFGYDEGKVKEMFEKLGATEIRKAEF